MAIRAHRVARSHTQTHSRVKENVLFFYSFLAVAYLSHEQQ